MLLAAGFAPTFPEKSLPNADLDGAMMMLEALLRAHEPYPALIVDRHWDLIAANRAVSSLTAGISQDLLRTPANVLRLTLHPNAMAPKIENLSQWRTYLLERLSRQVEQTADPKLDSLLTELSAYPVGDPGRPSETERDQIATPLRLRTDHGQLSFWSTTTIFDAPKDVTVSELMLETFLPADQVTREILVAIMDHQASP